MLMALLLLFVLALRSSVVTFVASLSSTLMIVISMVLINNPGVMSNNTRMMIAGLLFLMAVGSCDILTLLNIGDINNYFIINKAFFMFLLLLGFCDTVGLSCHDSGDHHVVGTRCGRSPDQAWQR